MTRFSTSNQEPSSSEGEVATQIGETVARVSRRLRADSARRLAPFGLTDGQARVLRMVGRATLPLRMSEIARRIQIVPRSATTIVEGLATKGLVVREIDPDDRRSILVRMTAAGTQLYIETGRARDKAAVELFGRLEPADQAALLALLRAAETAGEPARAEGNRGPASRRTPGHRR